MIRWSGNSTLNKLHKKPLDSLPNWLPAQLNVSPSPPLLAPHCQGVALWYLGFGIGFAFFYEKKLTSFAGIHNNPLLG